MAPSITFRASMLRSGTIAQRSGTSPGGSVGVRAAYATVLKRCGRLRPLHPRLAPVGHRKAEQSERERLMGERQADRDDHEKRENPERGLERRDARDKGRAPGKRGRA